MSGRVPTLRLRLPRIETKPKPVYAEQWQDFVGVGKNIALRDELDAIIESIERGDGVPETCYRAGIGLDRDGLLEDRGIMHLHLGGTGSDILLFLIQYSDRVVILETNTHVHFRTQPAGKNILALHQSWLGNLEREMQTAATAAREAATQEDRQQAEVLRHQRADAIASFKAKAGIP